MTAKDVKALTFFPWKARTSGEPWGPSNCTLLMAQACRAANITPAAGFHIIRHTAASHMVMAGVPLHVIAHNLGHCDSRMVEKHYGHMSRSYITETIRKFAPEYGTDDGNVMRLAAERR